MTTDAHNTPGSTEPRITRGLLHEHDVRLESGAALPNVTIAWTLIGELNDDRSNLVVVTHALTGTPEVHTWWRGVVGAGCALDPATHAILCVNYLGSCSGSTGPTDLNTPFPALTTRDLAERIWAVVDSLGVDQPQLICGGSLGGMVALELAALAPGRVQRVVSIAAPARQTALGAGWGALMRRAVAVGGDTDGLALARMIGMLSYRTGAEFETRFGGAWTSDPQPSITQWLARHGERLVQRFSAASYIALLDAMDRHDVGRDRGGADFALAAVAPKLTAVGIPGDLLYPADVVREWSERAGAEYREISSPHGHDAFLLEPEQVSTILRNALCDANAQRIGASATWTVKAPVSTRPARLTCTNTR